VVVDLGVGQIALLQTLGDERLDFRLLLVRSFAIHSPTAARFKNRTL
jgi:hypothetical protein